MDVCLSVCAHIRIIRMESQAAVDHFPHGPRADIRLLSGELHRHGALRRRLEPLRRAIPVQPRKAILLAPLRPFRVRQPECDPRHLQLRMRGQNEPARMAGNHSPAFHFVLRGEFINSASFALLASSSFTRAANWVNTAGFTFHARLLGPSFGVSGVIHPAATSGDTRWLTSNSVRPRKSATLLVRSEATKRG